MAASDAAPELSLAACAPKAGPKPPLTMGLLSARLWPRPSPVLDAGTTDEAPNWNRLLTVLLVAECNLSSGCDVGATNAGRVAELTGVKLKLTCWGNLPRLSLVTSVDANCVAPLG